MATRFSYLARGGVDKPSAPAYEIGLGSTNTLGYSHRSERRPSTAASHITHGGASTGRLNVSGLSVNGEEDGDLTEARIRQLEAEKESLAKMLAAIFVESRKAVSSPQCMSSINGVLDTSHLGASLHDEVQLRHKQNYEDVETMASLVSDISPDSTTVESLPSLAERLRSIDAFAATVKTDSSHGSADLNGNGYNSRPTGYVVDATELRSVMKDVQQHNDERLLHMMVGMQESLGNTINKALDGIATSLTIQMHKEIAQVRADMDAKHCALDAMIASSRSTAVGPAEVGSVVKRACDDSLASVQQLVQEGLSTIADALHGMHGSAQAHNEAARRHADELQGLSMRMANLESFLARLESSISDISGDGEAARSNAMPTVTAEHLEDRIAAAHADLRAVIAQELRASKPAQELSSQVDASLQRLQGSVADIQGILASKLSRDDHLAASIAALQDQFAAVTASQESVKTTLAKGMSLLSHTLTERLSKSHHDNTHAVAELLQAMKDHHGEVVSNTSTNAGAMLQLTTEVKSLQDAFKTLTDDVTRINTAQEGRTAELQRYFEAQLAQLNSNFSDCIHSSREQHAQTVASLHTDLSQQLHSMQATQHTQLQAALDSLPTKVSDAIHTTITESIASSISPALPARSEEAVTTKLPSPTAAGVSPSAWKAEIQELNRKTVDVLSQLLTDVSQQVQKLSQTVESTIPKIATDVKHVVEGQRDIHNKVSEMALDDKPIVAAIKDVSSSVTTTLSDRLLQLTAELQRLQLAAAGQQVPITMEQVESALDSRLTTVTHLRDHLLNITVKLDTINNTLSTSLPEQQRNDLSLALRQLQDEIASKHKSTAADMETLSNGLQARLDKLESMSSAVHALTVSKNETTTTANTFKMELVHNVSESINAELRSVKDACNHLFSVLHTIEDKIATLEHSVASACATATTDDGEANETRLTHMQELQQYTSQLIAQLEQVLQSNAQLTQTITSTFADDTTATPDATVQIPAAESADNSSVYKRAAVATSVLPSAIEANTAPTAIKQPEQLHAKQEQQEVLLTGAVPQPTSDAASIPASSAPSSRSASPHTTVVPQLRIAESHTRASSVSDSSHSSDASASWVVSSRKTPLEQQNNPLNPYPKSVTVAVPPAVPQQQAQMHATAALMHSDTPTATPPSTPPRTLLSELAASMSASQRLQRGNSAMLGLPFSSPIRHFLTPGAIHPALRSPQQVSHVSDSNSSASSVASEERGSRWV